LIAVWANHYHIRTKPTVSRELTLLSTIVSDLGDWMTMVSAKARFVFAGSETAILGKNTPDL
jgi:hypothetical protein